MTGPPAIRAISLRICWRWILSPVVCPGDDDRQYPMKSDGAADMMRLRLFSTRPVRLVAPCFLFGATAALLQSVGVIWNANSDNRLGLTALAERLGRHAVAVDVTKRLRHSR